MLTIGENFGPYYVRSALGAGGMGEIYLALDTRLKRDLAIKVLPAGLMKDPATVERFMREAHAASALNHPNILTIYDIGEYDRIRYIASEFVDGETLRERLNSRPPSLTEALDIAVQIAQALEAAHRAQIVHRDIKPENIMMRRDGYVKILDFGIAKLLEREPAKVAAGDDAHTQTMPGMILGTAAYMSPEQARGLEIDARSDIFSLGIVLYEMVAGRPPFTGATVSDLLAAILQTEPAPLTLTIKDALPELEWSVSRALSKNRDERYQLVRELAADLKRLRQRLEFKADSGGLTGRLTPPSPAASPEHPTLIFPARPAVRKTRKVIDSLAVLPLVNAAGDAQHEYLADGITESLINSLSKLPKLRVVPRTTVLRYRRREMDLQQIGEELGVRAVFAGRVLQLGDSIIVKTELVDIANQAQIWGEEYRRTMTDIFTLLDEIAGDIGEKLKIRLTGEDKKKLTRRYTDNTEAYELYLKGRYFVTSKRTEQWIKKGIECFDRAIELDPNYALAYAGIAEAYGFLASSTGGWPPHKAYPKAEGAALKALEIDQTLGEAHCSLGFFRLFYDWDLAEAGREFKKAIRLSPNYPNAHDGYGFYLKAAGRHAEAIENCRAVQRLDPLSPFAHISLGYAFYFARDYEKAIEECLKALELDKYSMFAYRNLGLAYLQTGRIDKAIGALSKAATFSSGGPAFESYLGFAYGLAGKRAEALEILENFRRTAEEEYIPAYNFALIYLGLNEIDETFSWLEKAFAERSGFLPFLAVEPMVDPLREDPRFADLVQRITTAEGAL